MDNKKVLCFIPAKASSKRLVRKNIKKICGKEMLLYAVDTALESNCFDKIVVSSESQEVLDIASSRKVDCVNRPPHLANDPYGVSDVLLDYYESNLEEIDKYEITAIILPTAPLVEVSDIKGALNEFKQLKVNCIISVTENDHNGFRNLTIQSGFIQPIFPELIKKKSQELQSTYRINGAIMFFNTKEFMKNKNYFFAKNAAFIMSKENSIDIDTIDDFKYAEYLVTERLSSQKH